MPREMAQKRPGCGSLGVVENMSYLVGTGQELFGSGGGQALAEEIDAPLLARIPFDPALREASDAGAPVLESDPESARRRSRSSRSPTRCASAGVCGIRKPLTVIP